MPGPIEYARTNGRMGGVTQLMYVGTDDDVTVVANRNPTVVKVAKIGIAVAFGWWLYKVGTRSR